MGVNKANCGGNVRGKTILVFKENMILQKITRSDCRGEAGLGFCVRINPKQTHGT